MDEFGEESLSLFDSMHFAQTLSVKPIVVWEMGQDWLVEKVKVVPSLKTFAFVNWKQSLSSKKMLNISGYSKGNVEALSWDRCPQVALVSKPTLESAVLLASSLASSIMLDLTQVSNQQSFNYMFALNDLITISSHRMSPFTAAWSAWVTHSMPPTLKKRS